tara:strand:- start:877 stop:1032 length:156 start_codon:yes stop_codon:yes gene_type:complete
MNTPEEIFQEIINMHFKNAYEAKDYLIALYGYLDKKVLADIQIKLDDYYDI